MHPADTTLNIFRRDQAGDGVVGLSVVAEAREGIGVKEPVGARGRQRWGVEGRGEGVLGNGDIGVRTRIEINGRGEA